MSRGVAWGEETPHPDGPELGDTAEGQGVTRGTNRPPQTSPCPAWGPAVTDLVGFGVGPAVAVPMAFGTPNRLGWGRDLSSIPALSLWGHICNHPGHRELSRAQQHQPCWGPLGITGDKWGQCDHPTGDNWGQCDHPTLLPTDHYTGDSVTTLFCSSLATPLGTTEDSVTTPAGVTRDSVTTPLATPLGTV